MRAPRPDYPLPALDVPEEFRRRLHPWIAGFIGLSPEEANQRVVERWKDLRQPSFRKLATVLSEFRVSAITDAQDGGSIHAERPGPDGGYKQSWYLPGPLPPDVLRQQLAARGLERDLGVSEFLHAFAGLAEAAGGGAGAFPYEGETWMTFGEGILRFRDDETGQGAHWTGALVLFYSANGCFVLVKQDRPVAWWVVQEGRIQPIAPTVEAFAEHFVDYKELNFPYDPYGP
jgi:hypothetical protein